MKIDKNPKCRMLDCPTVLKFWLSFGLLSLSFYSVGVEFVSECFDAINLRLTSAQFICRFWREKALLAPYFL